MKDYGSSLFRKGAPAERTAPLAKTDDEKHDELVRAIRSVASSIGYFTFVFGIVVYFCTCMLDH